MQAYRPPLATCGGKLGLLQQIQECKKHCELGNKLLAVYTLCIDIQERKYQH